MSSQEDEYKGCPVQYARQYLAGKWQMGILWNLQYQPLRFVEIRKQLPGISDKALMEELNHFVEHGILYRHTRDIPVAVTEYSLAPRGESLLPIIRSIVEWGYIQLQDEKVHRDMGSTPLSEIEKMDRQFNPPADPA